jgi:hypothetical protein
VPVMRIRISPQVTSCEIPALVKTSASPRRLRTTPSRCLRAIDTNNATTLLTYTITTGDVFLIVTLGQAEGSLPTQASYEEPGLLQNYVQTFNSVVELTNAFKGNKLRSEAAGPLDDRRIQALEKISYDIEFAYFFGIRNRILVSNAYTHYTGGIKDAIDRNVTTNALNAGGDAGITIKEFRDWLRGPMTSGSDVKLALCGPTAYSAFTDYANQASNGFRITQAENVFGMNITSLQTPFGHLDLAMHPLLTQNPSLNDWMFVIDLAMLKQKTMEPLFLEPNIQTPGQDSYKEQYRAKLGLKLKFANAFGYAASLRQII